MPRWTTRACPPSRRKTRYLPRRPTPVTVAPVRGASSSRRVRCRRMTRMALRVRRTRTERIVMPTISFSRSRRITSTSGSSGIRAGSGLPGFEPRQRLAGSFLLGLFLGAATPFAQLLAPEVHLGVEALGVVGAGGRDPVLRHVAPPAGGTLLEARLE